VSAAHALGRMRLIPLTAVWLSECAPPVHGAGGLATRTMVPCMSRERLVAMILQARETRSQAGGKGRRPGTTVPQACESR
jgi:hypothetical protein